eukprot:TRINITY_DN20360_c0_g1_i3.p1 TRINITY_DN20360_c0_g1~~TRINITY_DN20360_c0_g1_i3.p1  ORF type:complete len:223 (-),score=51.40 TRINITY_DN20360_c0_g1_i3:137-805(-)
MHHPESMQSTHGATPDIKRRSVQAAAIRAHNDIQLQDAQDQMQIAQERQQRSAETRQQLVMDLENRATAAEEALFQCQAELAEAQTRVTELESLGRECDTLSRERSITPHTLAPSVSPSLIETTADLDSLELTPVQPNSILSLEDELLEAEMSLKKDKSRRVEMEEARMSLQQATEDTGSPRATGQNGMVMEESASGGMKVTLGGRRRLSCLLYTSPSPRDS